MSKRNKYFIALIVFVSVSIVITSILSSKQKDRNKDQYEKYIYAMQMIKEQNKIDNGIEIIKELQKNNPKSDVLYMLQAQAYSNKGDFENSQNELAKALDVNMRLWKNTEFLIMYGEIAYLNDDYKKAKEMLIKAKEKGINEDRKSVV